MGQYFFDYVEDGQITRDEDGFELDGIAAARAQAVQGISEYIADRAKRGRNVDLAIVVRDTRRAFVRLTAHITIEELQ